MDLYRADFSEKAWGLDLSTSLRERRGAANRHCGCRTLRHVKHRCSDCYGGGVYEPLDQFTLSSGATITSFDLAQQLSGETTDFTIEIYNSDHSAIVFSQAVSASLAYDVNNTVIAHASVTGLSLAAGTYWAGFIAPVMYLQGFSTGNGSLIDSTPPHTGSGTFTLGGNTGYIFYGAAEGGVPEPASWAMMVGGFGLVGGAMRRRKSAISFA